MSRDSIKGLRAAGSAYLNATGQDAKSNFGGDDDRNGRVITGSRASYATGGMPLMRKGLGEFSLELIADNETATPAVIEVTLFEALRRNHALPAGVTFGDEEAYWMFRESLKGTTYSVETIRIDIPNEEYKKDTWQLGSMGFNPYDKNGQPLALMSKYDPTYMNGKVIDIGKAGVVFDTIDAFSFLTLKIRKNQRLGITFGFGSRLNLGNAIMGESVVEVKR